MGRPGLSVKESAAKGSFRGLGRHLEGWQLGALTVGLVLTAALVAIPRSTRPDVFPVPLIDVTELRQARAEHAALVESAAALPFETRAVGDALRRVGRALFRDDASEREQARRLLLERVLVARRAGQDSALRSLRAVQAELFERALQRLSEEPGDPEAAAEVAALGGDFLARAAENGWLPAGRLLGSAEERRALFEVRWTELCGLRGEAPFRPKLGDARRYYRFLLLHPEGARSRSKDALARARLGYVTALEKRDPEYPAALARGVLLAELGQEEGAAFALRRHLATAGAAWRLRARNYLRSLEAPLAAGEP